MARRSPPRKVTYFEPVPPRLARDTIIGSTFEVGRRGGGIRTRSADTRDLLSARKPDHRAGGR